MRWFRPQTRRDVKVMMMKAWTKYGGDEMAGRIAALRHSLGQALAACIQILDRTIMCFLFVAQNVGKVNAPIHAKRVERVCT
jgi:hypothetical protein